jgi:pantetheine-phosphate adenylyltransferase
MTTVKAIYPGTFDPITNGHLDIIHRSLKVCDELVVAIGINSAKKTMFTVDERLRMIDRCINSMDFLESTRVSVASFDGLLVNLAKQMGAKILIRGIRSVSDFEYEIGLANINKVIGPGVETVFLPTSPEFQVVSSSAAKEIAHFDGNIDKFVPSFVAEQIRSKFGFVKHGDVEK